MRLVRKILKEDNPIPTYHLEVNERIKIINKV